MTTFIQNTPYNYVVLATGQKSGDIIGQKECLTLTPQAMVILPTVNICQHGK